VSVSNKNASSRRIVLLLDELQQYPRMLQEKRNHFWRCFDPMISLRSE